MSDPLANWSTFALAILSFAGVGIAYWGIRKQTESLAKSVSADLCLKMVDRFDSTPMAEVRSLAARALLENVDLTLADDLFDFFELLGLYVRRNMMDEEIVHAMFFHWINLYWCAGRDYIIHSRRRSEDLYCDFERLYRKVLAVEMKNAPKSRDIHLSETDVTSFLRQEITS